MKSGYPCVCADMSAYQTVMSGEGDSPCRHVGEQDMVFLALDWNRELEGRNMWKEREEDKSKFSTD